MKALTILLSLTFFLNANCQDIANKVQNKTWFVTGDLLKSEKCLFNSEKPSTKVAEVKLLPDGLIKMPYDEDFILTSAYDIKKDMIKIYYTINYPSEKRQENVAHYYKIKELSNQKDFEFTPIASTDFK
jgi:hypothetical protein